MSFKKEKKEIIYWAKILNQKGFVAAKNGNISYKVSDNKILMTSHDAYLGFLEEKEILLVDSKGNILEGNFALTTEKKLHLDVYSKFKDVKVIFHAHPTYTTAFFNYFDELDVFSLETKFYLGNIAPIPQETPTVTDLNPVLKALENNNIVVLKNHGVVSVGNNFKNAFSLIEVLEEQTKVNFLVKNIVSAGKNTSQIQSPTEGKLEVEKKYQLLSEEHMSRLTEIVNNDKEVQDLGEKYDLTCTIAVKDQDTGKVACFYYQKGKIVKIDNNQNADFLIIGESDILKKVFNREMDPFVASTQGKVKTKGDFSKMSKWYPVLVRTFKLWEKAQVE